MTNSDWNYRTTEVLTAPPQKLQLLLLEAALRNIRRTEAAWQAGQIEAGYRFLEKARAIVGELLAAIRPERWPEVAPKVAGVYRFVYVTLAEAGLTQNQNRLRDAARVLEIERQTWQEVCQRLQGENPGGAAELAAAPKSAEQHPRVPDDPLGGLQATGDEEKSARPVSTASPPHLRGLAASREEGTVQPPGFSGQASAGFVAEA